jgi:ABC-type multidrug transport system permease subunit
LFSGSIFVGHLIIDKKLGIIKAFTKSFMLTTGFVSLFRLLVLSIFQFITFFGIFIVVILILSIFWGYEKLTYFDFFLIIFLMLIISFIIPILSLIISYFYKKLVEQVEANT